MLAPRALAAGAWLPPARPRPLERRAVTWRPRASPSAAGSEAEEKRLRGVCGGGREVGTGRDRWRARVSEGDGTSAGGAATALTVGRLTGSEASGGGVGAGRTGTPLASAARTGARREAELAQPGP